MCVFMEKGIQTYAFWWIDFFIIIKHFHYIARYIIIIMRLKHVSPHTDKLFPPIERLNR